MTVTTVLIPHTLPDCPQDKLSVTLCQHCGLNPARRRFCSSACRQAAYRKSPAHDANLDRQKKLRRERRSRWTNERRRSMSMTFDSRSSGSLNTNIPRLGEFEKSSAEFQIRNALIEIFQTKEATNETI